MIIQKRYFGYNYAYLSDYYKGKHDFPEHLHHFLEVQCVLEGETEITVGDVTELARAGDIVVIVPFQPHSQRTPEYCRLWIGLFSPTWVSDFFSQDNFCVPTQNVFTPSEATFAHIEQKLPPAYWLAPTRKIPIETYRKLKALYCTILEEFLSTVAIGSSTLKTDVLSNVYLYVLNHYQEEDLTLKKVAAAIGYTPNYISSCLSVISGANFRTILNSARVEHAKKLLVSTDMRIVDIALESGFSSENVFYGIFEKHTGQTPRNYRLFQTNRR